MDSRLRTGIAICLALAIPACRPNPRTVGTDCFVQVFNMSPPSSVTIVNGAYDDHAGMRDTGVYIEFMTNKQTFMQLVGKHVRFVSQRLFSKDIVSLSPPSWWVYSANDQFFEARTVNSFAGGQEGYAEASAEGWYDSRTGTVCLHWYGMD